MSNSTLQQVLRRKIDLKEGVAAQLRLKKSTAGGLRGARSRGCSQERDVGRRYNVPLRESLERGLVLQHGMRRRARGTRIMPRQDRCPSKRIAVPRIQNL